MKKIISFLFIANFTKLFSQGFEVAPVILNFSAEPGTSEKKTLTISNYFNQKKSFTLSAGDFSRNDKGDKVYYDAGKLGARSCSDWLTINPSYVEINPNESKEIVVTMTVPSGQNNTRWSLIYVRAAKEQSTFNADKSMSGGVVISPTIGIQVYQSPKSNRKYSAKISNLKEITKPGDKDRTLSVKVDNVGDKNLECKLFLLISNLEKATETKTKAIQIPMLPGGSQEAKLTLPNNLEKGTYSVAAILDYGGGTDMEGIQMEIIVK